MKYLIVGLGNIGKEYENTRHNIGFKILDNISEKLGSKFELKKYALYSNGKFKGRNIHLVKPSNFVNNSGKAVQYWANELKIKLENIIVVTDDLSLPFGKIRLKKKGSDGGHNGLKDIQLVLNSSKYSISCMALIFGAPVIEPIGKVVFKRSTKEKSLLILDLIVEII